MYAAGAKPYFDGMAVHLYENAKTRASWNIWDQTFWISGSVREIMDNHGDSAKLIHSSEGGANANVTGEAEQVTRMKNTYADFASRTRVGMACEYTMMNDDVPGFGMLRDDLSKRPVWAAFQQLALAAS
jgi:hypothetical protein